MAQLNADVKRLVGEAGYHFGVASIPLLVLHDDVLEVRRIGVFPNTTAARFRRKITGGYVFRGKANLFNPYCGCLTTTANLPTSSLKPSSDGELRRIGNTNAS